MKVEMIIKFIKQIPRLLGGFLVRYRGSMISLILYIAGGGDVTFPIRI